MQLAQTERPDCLEDVIGHDVVKKAIQHHAKSGGWPNVWLFYGEPGTGKTTLAWIIARYIQPDDGYIVEINASSQNKIDNARQLEEDSYSIPFNGQPRVFILNEYDRYTDEAQRAMKDPLEKSPSIWLLTTNRVDKIDSAIRSRAAAATFELRELTPREMATLVGRVLDGKVGNVEGGEVIKFLDQHKVYAPREILGVVDQYLAGIPLDKCLNRSEHEPLYADVARAVVRGQWSTAAGLLEKIKTCDSRAMIGVVSAFLKNQLLKEEIGPRADALAVCLCGLDTTGFADGTAYGNVVGLLYRCCKALNR